MKNETFPLKQEITTNPDGTGGAPAAKKPWDEPKLKFVEPRLTRHGELAEVTGQFFGAFSPGT
jgi:hypothetical protein